MSTEDAYRAAAGVVDPELRVVTIDELGILRGVETDGDTAVVTITPTYSGCPAMDVIRDEVTSAVRGAGYREVTVVSQLAPPWTTDWLTDSGRAKLAAAGIAPPGRVAEGGPVSLGLPGRRADPTAGDAATGGAATGDATAGDATTGGATTGVGGDQAVACPRCGARDTTELSRFGATACKALWRCQQCREPFEHMKAF